MRSRFVLQTRRSPKPAGCTRRDPTGRSPSALIPDPARRGFTIIELLVVIFIMAILATISYSAYSRTSDGERVRSGSRQTQSYLSGGRDRAIYANEARGVRFLLDDPSNSPGVPDTVSTMVFIGAPEKYTDGRIQIADDSVLPIEENSIIFSASDPPSPDWTSLVVRGLLVDGARLKVTAGSVDEYFHIAWDADAYDPITMTANAGVWKVTRTPITPVNWIADVEYELELEPAVLPNQQPQLLAANIVIDLNKSALPAAWGNVDNYSSRMDVLFSPRGNVIGDVTSAGLMHLFLADAADLLLVRAGNIDTYAASSATVFAGPDLSVYDGSNYLFFRAILTDATRRRWVIRDLNSTPITGNTINLAAALPAGFVPTIVRVEPIPANKLGDERIVTLNPTTGNVTTNQVNTADIFYYARTGEGAQ